MTKLEVARGQLVLNGDLLMYQYPAGDWDCIPWPLTSPYRSEQKLKEQLRVALWNKVETGGLPEDTKAAQLPDGEEFRL